MALAKTTRPQISGVFPRKRLFRELDRIRKQPIIWLQGPPGAGKTTLAASYIQERRLTCLWYQVDEGDADVATFFYHLRLAAPRRRRPLPVLSPENLASLTIFTQRFFRELYDRLKPPFALVLDNYQDAPVNSEFHEVVRVAFAELPPKGHVIVISRTGPPPALARLRASRALTGIGGADLRLTIEEARGLAKSISHERLSEATVQSLNKTVDGWAAGLVLVLEQMKSERQASAGPRGQNSQEIFDYFAWEIFRKSDRDAQEVLLQTAFLPRFTASMAQALTALPHAGQIIDGLSEEHYFTNKHPGAEPTYQYHPLFRNFLLAHAHKEFTSERRSQVLKTAARLLIKAEDFESALGLLLEAKDWEGLATLVAERAPSLLQQGRLKYLEERLTSFPEDILHDRPWLLYWFGVCRTPFNLQEPREYLGMAFSVFRQRKDAMGALLSAARIAETYCHELQDLRPLDQWINVLLEGLREHPSYPSVEIEASIIGPLLVALFLRQPDNPEIPVCSRRVTELLERTSDSSLQRQLTVILALYNLWLGDFNEVAAQFDRLRAFSKDKIPDWHTILGLAAISRCEWAKGENAACIKTVSDGLEIAEELQMPQVKDLLCAEGAVAALSLGNQRTARELIKKMGQSLEKKSKNDLGYYYYLLGWEALLRHDVEQAVTLTRTTVQYALDAGVPFMEAIARIMLAHALDASGRDKEALENLSIALDIAQRTKASFLEFMAQLLKAHIAFEQGEEKNGSEALARAFKLGSGHGYFNTYTWRPDVMIILCVRALESGIEPDYVKTLINKRRLIPKSPPVALEEWPWAVKVFTLGRFEFFKNSQPIEFSRKTQRKPLELLKALIAFGGRNVSENQLMEAIWPDAEADVAHQSLSTTLHRLRRLLGNEESLCRQGGKISLNPQLCWVDIWALENVLSRMEGGISKARLESTVWVEVKNLLDKAIKLYHGPFLAGEEFSWNSNLDDRLRRRLLRGLGELGRHYEKESDWEMAIEYYEKAVEIDACAEEFYRRIMAAHRHLGRRAEALGVYERCRKALLATMKVPPSAETEAIQRSLRAS